jgi:ubiquinone/menaquinone biosynthesis C-methylase UbiE
MLAKAKRKIALSSLKNIQFLLIDGRTIQLPDNSVDKIILVTVYHEVGEEKIVLKEFSRILKGDGRLIIVEIIRKGIFPGAPVQDPQILKTEIEANEFEFQQMLPLKNYGIFLFVKR